ncbi:hypothetical protein PRNP1_000902 [Phytophthora ramorum]
MQEFSEWMTTLQQHSPASSYAETDSADSDSDSDNSLRDDCQCRLEAKRKFVEAQRVWARTEPISIPSSGRPHPHLCASVAESPDLSYHADKRLLRAGRYLHHDEELDEDDPAFYDNLAFFRSQQGATQQARVLKRSVHPLQNASTSPRGVDDCDEDIFAMEL